RKLVFLLAACSGAAAAPPADPTDAFSPPCKVSHEIAAACASGLWGWAGDAVTGEAIRGVKVEARRGEALRMATRRVHRRFAVRDGGPGDWQVTFGLDDASLELPVTVGLKARGLGLTIYRGDVRRVEKPDRLKGAGDLAPDPSDPGGKLRGTMDYTKALFPPQIERCRL